MAEKSEKPIAWSAWNQGFHRSVRQAMIAAAEWLNHPDNPRRTEGRLWIIRHDTRKGWRLVNCGNRGPAPHEWAGGFYGPLTPHNIVSHLTAHRVDPESLPHTAEVLSNRP